MQIIGTVSNYWDFVISIKTLPKNSNLRAKLNTYVIKLSHNDRGGY